MSLDEEFKMMTTKVRAMNRPSDADILELYSLYKQATLGDCNISKPCTIDLIASAKWNAWQAKKGLSKEEAQEKYIGKGSSLGLTFNEEEEVNQQL